ncbi:PAS domain-containing protein, partial [Enterococcus faecalis]|uniref:PAS domain-containing protein n=1 Tax=Enterococcus faecalis TaxID=1351 RepID=UPI00403FAFB9
PAVKRALREVSERSRRRIAERQIRESEQRLRDIVDTSQDWIWELNGELRFVFSSESVQKILGLGVHAVIGMSSEDLVHDADREAFRAALR